MEQTPTTEDLSFEEAFRELEETVHRLESGDLTLEESITLFEKGQALAQHCGTALDQAELRVSQLSGTERGNHHQVAFDDESGESDERPGE